MRNVTIKASRTQRMMGTHGPLVTVVPSAWLEKLKLFIQKTCLVKQETQTPLSAQYHQIDATITSLTIMEMAPDIKCSGREAKKHQLKV